MKNNNFQLSLLSNTKNSMDVLKDVKDIFKIHFGEDNFFKVEQAYMLIASLFDGNFPGYRKCNTDYHNLSHTMDTFLATARLMDGWIIDRNEADHILGQNLLIAALLHDTGYIQEESDTTGTGAKHTKIHVHRSIEFLFRHAESFHLDRNEANRVASYIEFTGLNSNFTVDLPDEHYTAGTILGTADLLGQMSDRTYLEKLLFLYYEFQEAGFEGYDTEFDILKKTLNFYESTLQRLDYSLKMNYKYARIHFRERYSIDENLYLTAINNQMTYLRKIIEDQSSNFRKKLHRLNIDDIEKKYNKE